MRQIASAPERCHGRQCLDCPPGAHGLAIVALRTILSFSFTPVRLFQRIVRLLRLQRRSGTEIIASASSCRCSFHPEHSRSAGSPAACRSVVTRPTIPSDSDSQATAPNWKYARKAKTSRRRASYRRHAVRTRANPPQTESVQTPFYGRHPTIGLIQKSHRAGVCRTSKPKLDTFATSAVGSAVQHHLTPVTIHNPAPYHEKCRHGASPITHCSPTLFVPLISSSRLFDTLWRLRTVLIAHTTAFPASGARTSRLGPRTCRRNPPASLKQATSYARPGSPAHFPHVFAKFVSIKTLAQGRALSSASWPVLGPPD